MKKKLEIFIFGLLGLMFVFSALIKLFPIEAFELQLIKLQLFNWENSPYFARLLIILEFTFGLFLLQKNNIKKIFVPIAFLLLQLFNVILVFQLIYLPEVKNCGCFGEFLPMTPIQALIKNIFLSLILIYVYRNNIKVGVNSYIIIVLVIISIIAILIMFPIKKYKIQSIVATKTETVVNNFAIQKQGTNLNGTTVFEKKDTHLVIKKSATKKTLSIFTSYKKFNGVRNEIDLNSGLKIVALFSLDCDECRNTAIKLKKMRTLGIYFGINNISDNHYASMLVVNAIGFGNNEPRYYYPGLPGNIYGGVQLMF